MAYKHILNFWPLVPAMDIEAIYETLLSKTKHTDEFFDIPFSDYKKGQSMSSSSLESRTREMNILIIGDGTGALIKTIARMHRHEDKTLNIYVVSNFAESLSRTLLLLSLFSVPPESMGNLEKAEIFLEIFGNTFLRAATAGYIKTKSGVIIEDILSTKKSLNSIPIVSLEFLKQCEIDEIFTVLGQLKSSVFTYDVAKAWDNSLRAYFRTKYDNRKNLFDYLYNMRLSQYPIISLRKYIDWSETGTAFKLRRGRYDHPNKTLSTKRLFSDAKLEYYYGDIATSPYIAFGVECKNEELFEKVNNQLLHTSEDVSKFNIIDYMTEYSSNVSQTEEHLSVYLFFYSTFRKMRKFKDFFDVVYLTCDMTSFAENGSIGKCLKKDGVAIFETVENVVNSTKERKLMHSEEIDRLAGINNLKSDARVKDDVGCFKVFLANDNGPRD